MRYYCMCCWVKTPAVTHLNTVIAYETCYSDVLKHWFSPALIHCSFQLLITILFYFSTLFQSSSHFPFLKYSFVKLIHSALNQTRVSSLHAVISYFMHSNHIIPLFSMLMCRSSLRALWKRLPSRT